MYGYIYKTTNKINGKVYVGQHKSNSFDESYLGSGVAFSNALKKYGRDNFVCEVIEWCEDLDSMNEREIYWIAEFDSTNKEIGYNISEGGGVFPTYLGEDHPNWGGQYSPKGEDHYLWGRKRSQETIEKIKETKRLNPNSLRGITRTDEENIANRKAQPHRKEVVVAKNDNLIVFDTINQASKYIGIPRRSLSYYLDKYGEHKVDDWIIKFYEDYLELQNQEVS